MIKYVMFDFDGTIADSKRAIVSSWNRLAKKYRYKEITFEELDELKKLSLKERSQLLNFPLRKIPVVLPQLYKLFLEARHQVKLFDGMKEVLSELGSKGYKVIIISSNSRDNILDFLKLNEINNVTKVICSSSFFGKDKLIQRFLRESQLGTSEVIYVGDEHRDIVACKKVGVKIVWVGWGYDSIEVVEAAEPDYKVYTPADIMKII
ncbi:HAD-IA family hydrolase [Bacillus sp. PS06]|uniref:HAD-IA family hydrolase n=1 Tax=Bacillus sp. PS06 TaxID=2764176 RepID=UPI0017868A89|nr:HAD-IA family hydrolase [Bacillus sp. PS06]MBD8069372.1 HAD-IA family hydrolase [Bacillus sp. PS06]